MISSEEEFEKKLDNWQDYFKQLFDDLRRSTPDKHGELLNTALKNVNLGSGMFIFRLLSSSVLREFFGSGGFIYFLTHRYKPQLKINKFKDIINYLSVDSYANALSRQINESRFYYESRHIPVFDALKMLFFIHYFKRYSERFFSGLDLLIKSCQEFFEGNIEIKGYGIGFIKGTHAFYQNSHIYLCPSFLSNYAGYIGNAASGDYKSSLEISVLGTIAHEMAHDVSFKFRKGLTSFAEKLIQEQLNNFYNVLLETGFSKGDFNLCLFLMPALKYFKKKDVMSLSGKLNEFSNFEKLKESFNHFKKARGIELSESDEEFIIKFPYSVISFLYNLLFLEQMVIEFPAIGVEFLYLLYYFREKLGSDAAAINKMNSVLGVQGKDAGQLFIRFLKETYGKTSYRAYGQFRYPELKKFFKKYDLTRLRDTPLFMKEVNNLKDVSGLKKQWFDLISRMIKLIEDRKLFTDKKTFKEELKRLKFN